jgi:hypothetical protein
MLQGLNCIHDAPRTSAAVLDTPPSKNFSERIFARPLAQACTPL